MALDAELLPKLEPWGHLCNMVTDYARVWQEVEEKQKQSLAARRELAAMIRGHESLDESLDPVTLRCLQEIGSLSKRATFAEEALADLISALRVLEQLKQDLPLLQSSRAVRDVEEQLRQREVSVAQLSAAAVDLEAELQTMRNQDVAVRRLQKQVKELEVEREAGAADLRRQKDEQWERKTEELRQELTVARLQHGDALAQVAHQWEHREEELERLRQQHLEEHRLSEQSLLARSLEVDSLTSDLEKAQAELEQHRLQRAEGKEPHGSTRLLQSLLDGAQLRVLSLEREVADLRRRLAEADAQARQADASRQAEREVLLREAHRHAAETAELREALAVRPSAADVEQLRQQLRNAEAVKLTDEGAASTDLERRLLQRQRALEGQLSEARVREQEAAADHKALSAQLEELQHTAERLGAELTATAAVPPGPPPASPLESLLGAEAGTEGMPSMLEIVTGQRERLRERVGGLEQERDRWRAAGEQQRQRAEALHADNVKLLERARFLQSFQPKQGRGRVADRDLEDRYGQNGSSAFEQFREEEKARRVEGLNAGERVLVLVGTLLLSSKVVRLFVLSYAVVMHLLVFAVLLRLAQMQHSC